MAFEAFTGQKYLNLETFKKSGDGVRTPVWFAADTDSHDKLYVYTMGISGKVKRIRNNGNVRIASCDMRGNVKGEWVNARAEIIRGTDAARAMKLINNKYVPWKQLLDFFAMFRKRERIVFALHPA